MSGLRVTVVCCMLACAGHAGAAELGRLFFTPAQRALLDNARKQNSRVEVGNDGEQQQAPPVPQNVSVTGLVQRSDGKSTVWLNNRAVTEQQQAGGGIIVTTDKKEPAVKLTVPESGRSVNLKVGQTVEVVSGTIAEGYSHRPISKGAEKAAPTAEAARPGEAAAKPPQGVVQPEAGTVPVK